MAHMYYEDYIEDTTEKYNESEDDDFNPDGTLPEEASSSSGEEETVAQPTQRNGKRKALVIEELDSGDEVTIKAARNRRAKKLKKSNKDDDAEDLILSDDEGGQGGLVKTRAQRRVEQIERRPLARTEGATINVDALWAKMISAPLKPLRPITPQKPQTSCDESILLIPHAETVAEEGEQVAIKKTYTFAGQDTTEEKSIPRSQLENYLSNGWKPTDVPETSSDVDSKPKANTSKYRRPVRRPTRFDPNPTGYVRALAPEHQLTYPRATATALHRRHQSALVPSSEPPNRMKAEKTQKLNVVDKSRMDWTGFVNKGGIAEELNTHGKTKEAYLGRMEFLAGVEARREEERKRVKVAAGTT